MLLIREIMHCKPGKVRPMVDKFLTMSRLNEKAGFGKMRVMTDFAGERYWTIVAQFEVESMEDPGLLLVMSEERDLMISIPVSQVPSFQSPESKGSV